MPLKPIYEKSPMKTLSALSLRPGQVSVACGELKTLLNIADAAQAQSTPKLWEAIFRAGCASGKKAQELIVTGWIQDELDKQEENGALALSMENSLAVMRAAFALYEYDAKRTQMEKMLKWCAFLASDMDNALECAAIRCQSADLMELLENLYRVTGKKGVLSLCERLRQKSMDWSGILHTFAVQRPMSRVTPWSDMEAGLEAEQGNEQGFYTRQYLTCHGRHLANGARAALNSGLYSGNGVELSAAKTGWEKITRYHGAVCGGVTCDGLIGGASPSACVDASALGAWAETLCAAAVAEDAVWAFEALDVMLENAMPKALKNGTINCLQRVNGLADDCGNYGVYHDEADREAEALTWLLRGYAAICSHAMMTRKNGVDINLYLAGKYAAVVQGTVLNAEVSCEGEQIRLVLSCKQEIKAAVRLRVPSWADMAVDCCGSEVRTDALRGYVTLERTWKNGDTITCTLKKKLRVVSGHHQSVSVMLGATLLAMPASAASPWAMALTGDPVQGEDGCVKCMVAPVPDWRKHGHVPSDVPVLPRVEGDGVEITLAPYAQSCGIALFPKGSRA